MVLEEHIWQQLVESISDKKCVPFIGAGAVASWLSLGSDIAKKWANEYGYPLDDYQQLSKVAQFLATIKNDMYPNYLLSREIKGIKLPDFSSPEFENTPPAVLANLNLPLYITTNYDHVIEEALKSRGKMPVSEFCRWNEFTKEIADPSVFENRKYKYIPSSPHPLVYHLHGDIDIPQSMVLTEDDYIDFMVTLLQDAKNLLPPLIRKALATTTVLFVGYSLEDVNFRLIFRYLMDSVGIRFMSESVAVLLPPSNLNVDAREQALTYLDRRAKNMFKTSTYWGGTVEFSRQLRERLDRAEEMRSKDSEYDRYFRSK